MSSPTSITPTFNSDSGKEFAIATIALHIRDGIQRVTLKTMLESDGHRVHAETVTTGIELAFCDLQSLPALDLRDKPIVVVTPATHIHEAVAAMRNGVWGYIVTPFLPQEATLVVARALSSGTPDSRDSLSTLPTMEAVEFEHIRRALRLCDGNQAQAARALNIGRNTLWRKLKKMEQQSPDE